MLYTLGFQPTRFDSDVWIKKRSDNTGYNDISTYVNDFLITAKDPWAYMEQEIYAIKDPKVPDSYLGANYIGDPQENRSITAKKYIREAISQIEKHLGIML